MTEQLLYHFSEDPEIKLFQPRPGRQIEDRPDGELLVWAIDEERSPVYFFPRECPRIVLWPVEGSISEDIRLWMGGDARMVAHIESAWIERLESCQLYRYSFETTGFENLNDHGVHVSPNSVEPVSVDPVGSLEKALQDVGVELRVMDSLQSLTDAWHSSLHFSGVRLRNATDWAPPA